MYYLVNQSCLFRFSNYTAEFERSSNFELHNRMVTRRLYEKKKTIYEMILNDNVNDMIWIFVGNSTDRVRTSRLESTWT